MTFQRRSMPSHPFLHLDCEYTKERYLESITIEMNSPQDSRVECTGDEQHLINVTTSGASALSCSSPSDKNDPREYSWHWALTSIRYFSVSHLSIYPLIVSHLRVSWRFVERMQSIYLIAAVCGHFRSRLLRQQINQKLILRDSL